MGACGGTVGLRPVGPGGIPSTCETDAPFRGLYSRPRSGTACHEPPSPDASSLILAFAPALAAAQLPAGVKAGPTVEGITEYTLANGLEVLLFPDASKPTTTVNVTYRSARATRTTARPAWRTCSSTCCSRARRRSRQHLAGARPARHARSTARRASTAPTTSRPSPRPTRTSTGRSTMEADRMVQLVHPKKDLDTEMTVVRNEFESGENNPQRVLWQRMQASRLRLAQLRQVDDRRALGHRERRHRAPAGVLPHLLPARQRGADRRRQVRSGDRRSR